MKHRCLSDRKNALSWIARYILKAYFGTVMILEKPLSLITDCSLSVHSRIYLAEVLRNFSMFSLALEMPNLTSVGSQELNEAQKQWWLWSDFYCCYMVLVCYMRHICSLTHLNALKALQICKDVVILGSCSDVCQESRAKSACSGDGILSLFFFSFLNLIKGFLMIAILKLLAVQHLILLH